MDLPRAEGRMAGPPSLPLPAGDAVGESTPDVVGDKSCTSMTVNFFVHAEVEGGSNPRWPLSLGRTETAASLISTTLTALNCAGWTKSRGTRSG